MTTIKWQGKWQDQLQEGVRPALSPPAETQEQKRSAGVLPGGLQFFSASSQKRQQGVLATALDTALRRLTERIDAASSVSAASASGNQSLTPAKPSTFTSSGFDPNAQTTLSPGSYTLNYALGPLSGGASGEAGSLTLTVNSGDTWQDVLSRMTRVFGSASTAMLSELVPAKRTFDLPQGQHGVTGGVGLTISQNADTPGWRLTLTGADAASTALLKTLGLNATAQPGADAGTLSGQASLTGNFGEAAPLGISSPVERLAGAVADVLQSYNEVRGLLLSPSGQVKGGMAVDWRKPVAERKDTLSGLGLTESRTDQSLWFDGEKFLTTLLARPDVVEGALLGADGLFPALRDKAGQYLASGTDSLLSPPEASPGNDPLLREMTARTEAQVEKSNQLLDLFDGLTGVEASKKPLESFGLAGPGGILSRKG